MILIPAVDILAGKCVRLLQGDYNQVTEYGNDPLAIARQWEERGARRLHLVDLDGARAGRPVGEKLILNIANSLSRPVEVGGGIRTLDHISRYLDAGVDRVILGTAAFRRPELIEEASERYPGRVWVGIDSRDGRVSVEGWVEQTSIDTFDLAATCEDRGAAGIIFTDISRDGMLTGPNLISLKALSQKVGIPLIASGGVSSLDDLAAIRNLGIPSIEGIITGKALYSGAFSIEEAIQIVEG